jgi:hypothetical protein
MTTVETANIEELDVEELTAAALSSACHSEQVKGVIVVQKGQFDFLRPESAFRAQQSRPQKTTKPAGPCDPAG